MDSELEKMKKNLLEDQMGFLCEELGDPGRYFPFFRSKKMLDSSDCQHIRSLSTFKDQIQELIERLKSRESNKGEGGFDVLVDALKKQRVQAHIARALQKALAKAKEEAVTTPSSGMITIAKPMCCVVLYVCFVFCRDGGQKRCLTRRRGSK